MRSFESIQKNAKLKGKMAKMKAGINIGDNEATPAIEKVEGNDIVKQVKLALDKCRDLYKGGSYEVLRRGEYKDKIQEIKGEFTRLIEIARSRVA